MAASVLRYWKESATLIIVRRLQPKQCYKEVVAVPPPQENTPQRPETNYQVFMAERTPQMSSFPKAHVFPGGAAEEADFSAQWLDVLSMGSRKPGEEQTPEGQMVNLFKNNRRKNGVGDDKCSKNNSGTPMYRRPRLPEFSAIPSEVAFRITAIREIFEEIGVLFARKAEENKTDEDKNESLMQNHDTRNGQPLRRRCIPKICHLPLDLSEFWRQSVVEDPENLLSMCKQLKLVPDITALSEWANWLTPTHFSGKRFDTMFYITFLDEHQNPNIRLDGMEYVDYKWLSPIEFVSQAISQKLNIFPPQLWELYHLNSRWEDLHNSVTLNPYSQPMRFLPVRIKCKDGVLVLLPGDYLYPEKPNEEKCEELFLPFTKNEMRSSGKFLNHLDPQERKIYRTVPLSLVGHTECLTSRL
uniref:Nudix hydrolase domain-containing protein n=1 Tax=Octopus bimaculoides TaxID=37653 RepID=A0A0L8GF30_OCTBM|eukprot:XP_014781634.1 PREDICTED: nucleoside diphosphate-linked moiety X motif 19, mitochondrial-like isoform X1 [Octopus bimaculoides]